MRDRIKWLLFPGLNLHARQRGRLLPGYFGCPPNGHPHAVLDAGCGNGMLAYAACLRGSRVLGISIKQGEIERNRRLFHDHLGVSPDQLTFQVHNIYDLASLGRSFDEIICTEVLEHIADDAAVCRSFFSVLKPGGMLHLCCPNAEHPDHQAHSLDQQEAGGHVRPGYTMASYRGLLEPIGFQIIDAVGLGGPMRQAINKRIIRAQEKANLATGLALFMATWPLHNLDRGQPRVPYSLYVKAVKPKDLTTTGVSGDGRNDDSSSE